MVDLAAKYLAHAQTCARTDYGSHISMLRHNRAAQAMRKIVTSAYKSGADGIEGLLPLLDRPPADSWLAFQLLDLGSPPLTVLEQCLAIIQRRAAQPGPEGIGAAIWLREWLEKHPETPLRPMAQ